MKGLVRRFFSINKNHPMLEAFEDKKCIFFHIPKTAGVAVSTALFGNIKWGHRNAAYYIEHFGNKAFSSFYKFTIVRNPYDRLYSAFIFLKNGGINEADYAFSKNYLSKFSSFDDFVRNGLEKEVIRKWVHFLPQSHFVIDKKGQLVVDFVGKMETLNDDFLTICNSIKVNAKLVAMNQTKDKREIIMTDETKSIIRHHYITDFKLFYPDLF